MKKSLTVILFLLIAGSVFAQYRSLKNDNPAMETGQNVSSATIFRHTAPILDNILQYPGEIPGTSNFWDYQTNGASLSSIVVLGDTIIVCYPAVDSTDPTGLTTRLAYYIESEDNGVTWSTPFALSILPLRSGYPDMSYFYSSGGTSVILSGRRYTSSSSFGGVWVDAALGLGSFTSAFVPPAGKDYFGAYLGSNFYGGIFSSVISTTVGDSLSFCKYNVNTNVMSGQTVLAIAPNGIALNTRYRMAANSTGSNIFAMWYDATVGAYAMRYKVSTDGGTTFGALGSLQTAFGFGGVVNGDTCSPWFGIDAAYKPGTTNWGAVWSTLYPTATGQSAGDPQGCKILFSSPGINGGLPVEVAGKSNMSIISDTSLFFNRDSLQVGVTPISHPSIAYSADGSRIVVAFSGFQPGQVKDGNNFNDIYVTYSDNGGLNWATPVNMTNTATWDELYPTLSLSGNTNTSFKIQFQATRGPGSQSFTDLRPVYRVYHVFKNFNPTNVSVNQIGSNVPSSFSLKQNYPNPFNPSTTIRFDISKSSMVILKVYDLTGREIATLVNERLNAGTKEITFDASALTTGVYFYTLNADGYKETKKMMLVK